MSAILSFISSHPFHRFLSEGLSCAGRMLQEEKGISVGRVGGVGMEALITGPFVRCVIIAKCIYL